MSHFHEAFWSVAAGAAPVLMLSAAVNFQQQGRRLSAMIDTESQLRKKADIPHWARAGSPEANKLHAFLRGQYRVNLAAAVLSALIFGVAMYALADGDDVIAVRAMAIALGVVAVVLVGVMMCEFVNARRFSEIHETMPDA